MEIEGRVVKKLSQDFSRTESRILGALSKLDEFLLKPQIRTHSGTIPGTFRNTNVENQGTNKDDSQSDPHPEAGIFGSQTTQNSGQKLATTIIVNHYRILYSKGSQRLHFDKTQSCISWYLYSQLMSSCYNSQNPMKFTKKFVFV